MLRLRTECEDVQERDAHEGRLYRDKNKITVEPVLAPAQGGMPGRAKTKRSPVFAEASSGKQRGVSIRTKIKSP